MMAGNFLETVAIASWLPANSLGRDFVMGDIHGMADQVDMLLEAVSFDGKTDRLFLVGDLIDRGPKSLDALRLLLRPYVHAVMGNHEKMLLCAIWSYFKPEIESVPAFFECKPTDVIFNGSQWLFNGNILNITEDWLNRLIEDHPDFPGIVAAVAQLPLVLSVGTDNGRFHVLHAEFPGDWTDHEIDRLPASLPIDQINKDTPIPSCWKRSIFNRNNIEEAPMVKEGLSPTFTGHTIGVNVRQAFSHINLDTGAYKLWQLPDIDDNGDRLTERYGLTMINAKTLSVYRLGPQRRITQSIFQTHTIESAELEI